MSAAKKYADAVKAQSKAEKALAEANDAWSAATDHSTRIRCKFATEAAERDLQARIHEVAAAHAQYWSGRAAELVPALEELALVAARFDAMRRAAGGMTVEPWLQIVRGVLGGPLPPDVLGSLVGDVPLRAELSDEFDCPEAVLREGERVAKLVRGQLKARKWV